MNELDLIFIPKSYWISSELSIARFQGGIIINGQQYDIVPPYDDLVRSDIKDLYQFFGRTQLSDFAKNKLSINQIRLLMLDERKNKKNKPIEVNLNQELSLF